MGCGLQESPAVEGLGKGLSYMPTVSPPPSTWHTFLYPL